MSTGVFSRKLAQVQKTRESVGKIGADFEKFEKCIYLFVSWAEDKKAAYQILDRIKHAVIWPDVIEQTDYDLEIDQRYRDLSYTKIMPNDSEDALKIPRDGRKILYSGNTIRFCDLMEGQKTL